MDMLGIICLVIDVLLWLAILILALVVIQNRRLTSADKIKEMDEAIRELQAEVEALKGGAIAIAPAPEAAPAEEKAPEAPEAPAKAEPAAKPLKEKAEAAAAVMPLPKGEPGDSPDIWHDFVEEYNNVARTASAPNMEAAVKKFADDKKLTPLMCIEPAAMDGNRPMPKFISVTDIMKANFWAWAYPSDEKRFAIVPNPAIPYVEALHNEGGMKETFASNFDKGEYKEIEVKLPAIFENHDGNWIIEQPGLIRLEPGA